MIVMDGVGFEIALGLETEGIETTGLDISDVGFSSVEVTVTTGGDEFPGVGVSGGLVPTTCVWLETGLGSETGGAERTGVEISDVGFWSVDLTGEFVTTVGDELSGVGLSTGVVVKTE
jgi:hypothetical protein